MLAELRTPKRNQRPDTNEIIAMDLALHGRKALITGASQGIGLEIARRLVEEGCDVVLAARTASDLENRARQLRGDTGRTVEIDATDISDGDQVVALAQRHRDIDILINNAGAIPGGHLLDIDEATWRKSWDLKVFGYINMCREFYRAFKEHGRGTIGASRGLRRKSLLALYTFLPVRLRLDQAGIDRKALAADQALIDAAPQHCLKEAS